MSKKSKHDPLQDLSPTAKKDTEKIHVIIDTPQGSHNKYSYNEKKLLFKLTKVLPAGAVFPFNFGYIPSTLAEDGDALDVLVLMDEPAFPGCLIDVRLIGVIEAEQTKAGKSKAVRNDRLIAVAVESYMHEEVSELDQVSPTLLDEIEHFFISYNAMEDKRFTPIGRYGSERAEKLLQKGRERFKKED